MHARIAPCMTDALSSSAREVQLPLGTNCWISLMQIRDSYPRIAACTRQLDRHRRQWHVSKRARSSRFGSANSSSPLSVCVRHHHPANAPCRRGSPFYVAAHIHDRRISAERTSPLNMPARLSSSNSRNGCLGRVGASSQCTRTFRRPAPRMGEAPASAKGARAPLDEPSNGTRTVPLACSSRSTQSSSPALAVASCELNEPSVPRPLWAVFFLYNLY